MEFVCRTRECALDPLYPQLILKVTPQGNGARILRRLGLETAPLTGFVRADTSWVMLIANTIVRQWRIRFMELD